MTPDRILSTNDPEMRFGHKTSHGLFAGERFSIPENPDSEILTNLTTPKANSADASVTLLLLREQKERYGLRPKELFGDCAYGAADHRVALEQEGIPVVAKVPEPPGTYFPKRVFQIDWERDQVTCPNGVTSTSWKLRKDSEGRPVKLFQFDGHRCKGCPLRDQCTRTPERGRTLTLHFHEAVLQKAREEQKTPEFREKILRRPIVERKIAELKRQGLGKARYFGLLKAKLQAFLTAAVVNFKRVAKYLSKEREPCGACAVA